MSTADLLSRITLAFVIVALVLTLIFYPAGTLGMLLILAANLILRYAISDNDKEQP